MGLDDGIWSHLWAEQDTPTSAAKGGEVTYAQTQSMPLLDSFIAKVLRMHPPAPAFRVATADMAVLGRHVRRGENVLLDFPAVMRDPVLFESPDEMRVDRFV